MSKYFGSLLLVAFALALVGSIPKSVAKEPMMTVIAAKKGSPQWCTLEACIKRGLKKGAGLEETTQWCKQNNNAC